MFGGPYWSSTRKTRQLPSCCRGQHWWNIGAISDCCDFGCRDSDDCWDFNLVCIGARLWQYWSNNRLLWLRLSWLRRLLWLRLSWLRRWLWLQPCMHWGKIGTIMEQYLAVVTPTSFITTVFYILMLYLPIELTDVAFNVIYSHFD